MASKTRCKIELRAASSLIWTLSQLPFFPKYRRTCRLGFLRLARVRNHSESTKVPRTFTQLTFPRAPILCIWNRARRYFGGRRRPLIFLLKAAFIKTWNSRRFECVPGSWTLDPVERGGDKPEKGLQIIDGLHFLGLLLSGRAIIQLRMNNVLSLSHHLFTLMPGRLTRPVVDAYTDCQSHG